MPQEIRLKSDVPFYLMRHGETDWNRDGIIMGRADIPLNDTGIKQAHDAQKYFEGIALGAIYTSSLKRAQETASIINQKRKLPFFVEPMLVEYGWGEWEGQPHEHFIGKVTEIEMPGGGESWLEFESRVVDAIQNILVSYTHDDPPLIVAHGGVFSVLGKIMGFSRDIPNAVPYFFSPPLRDNTLWVINEMREIPPC